MFNVKILSVKLLTGKVLELQGEGEEKEVFKYYGGSVELSIQCSVRWHGPMQKFRTQLSRSLMSTKSTNLRSQSHVKDLAFTTPKMWPLFKKESFICRLRSPIREFAAPALLL